MRNISEGKGNTTIMETPDGSAYLIINKPLATGGWVATIEDITERRKLEQERDRNHAFLREIIDHIPTQITVKDAHDGRYVLVNSVADEAGDEELTPTEIAEAIRDCLELDEVDAVPNVRRYLGEALDAVSDGMPADFVAMTLYAALGALREGGSS